MTLPVHAHRAAYFSMEIALKSEIPTYAGGLGVLSGDTLRSAADEGLPIVGITLLYRKGYFEQHLDGQGNQWETPSSWNPESVLEPTDIRISIPMDGRKVAVRAWRYPIQGFGGHFVPVYFLDTALPENSPFDQSLTDYLYGGDDYYRLCQEIVLGIGGVEVLNALGYSHISTYHMNEGHAALLTVAVLEAHLAREKTKEPTEEDLEFVRRRCAFTTHTPVPAGTNRFPRALIGRVLGEERLGLLEKLGAIRDDVLNLTFLGIRGSHYVNGVAMQHGEVSRSMFPDYPIHAITNGVHATTWTSPPFQELFDKHIPEWRRDNLYLRYAIGIPIPEIQNAHAQARRALIAEIERATGVRLDENVMTVGFARRAATYKRADFLFSDADRLKSIVKNVGPFQVIYSGKAHPQDDPGKEMIRKIFAEIAALKDVIRIVYVPNYDMRWGLLISSGSDLWLNTPHRPFEASGTSGMKAALNGVPSLSVPDGWWREGHVEGATGWDIGEDEVPATPTEEADSLYRKLAKTILPTFYQKKDAYAQVMRLTIALNGSFFNTQRMVAQYAMNAYFSGNQRLPAQQANAGPPQRQ